jgi:hypothetical protein
VAQKKPGIFVEVCVQGNPIIVEAQLLDMLLLYYPNKHTPEGKKNRKA